MMEKVFYSRRQAGQGMNRVMQISFRRLAVLCFTVSCVIGVIIGASPRIVTY